MRDKCYVNKGYKLFGIRDRGGFILGYGVQRSYSRRCYLIKDVLQEERF